MLEAGEEVAGRVVGLQGVVVADAAAAARGRLAAAAQVPVVPRQAEEAVDQVLGAEVTKQKICSGCLIDAPAPLWKLRAIL